MKFMVLFSIVDRRSHMDSNIAGLLQFPLEGVPAGIDNQTMTFAIAMNSPSLAGHSIA